MRLSPSRDAMRGGRAALRDVDERCRNQRLLQPHLWSLRSGLRSGIPVRSRSVQNELREQ